MSRIYSLAYLTTTGLPPVQAVHLAARLGFDRISFRLLPAGPGDTPPPILDDDRLMAEVVAAMADTGVTFGDAEMIRLDQNTDLGRFRPFLDRIATMGARHILVAGDDPDRARITDTYGRLCELVWQYGLTADLEFMPWTQVRTIADARDLTDAASHPAAAILVDSLHFDRCGSTLDELSDIPPALMNYVQICDGPVPYDPDDAAMMAVGRTARLIPGQGGIDLPAFADRLPPDIAVSIEVPNAQLSGTLGTEELTRRALTATRALLGD